MVGDGFVVGVVGFVGGGGVGFLVVGGGGGGGVGGAAVGGGRGATVGPTYRLPGFIGVPTTYTDMPR